MALNNKNPEVGRLADPAGRLEARGAAESRGERLGRFLRTRVWPYLPASVRGKPLTKKQKEELLGYGPDGV